MVTFLVFSTKSSVFNSDEYIFPCVLKVFKMHFGKQLQAAVKCALLRSVFWPAANPESSDSWSVSELVTLLVLWSQQMPSEAFSCLLSLARRQTVYNAVVSKLPSCALETLEMFTGFFWCHCRFTIVVHRNHLGLRGSFHPAIYSHIHTDALLLFLKGMCCFMKSRQSTDCIAFGLYCQLWSEFQSFSAECATSAEREKTKITLLSSQSLYKNNAIMQQMCCWVECASFRRPNP